MAIVFNIQHFVHYDSQHSPLRLSNKDALFFVGCNNILKYCVTSISYPAVYRTGTVRGCFGVEYIYGFVGWGVCMQSRDVTALPSHIQDGGYALLWQRYDNNKMAAICYSTSSTVQS